MNCPNCKVKMIWGYIQSACSLIWTVKEHKILIIPNEKKGDVWVGGEDNSFGTVIRAFRCPECETIIVPPADKQAAEGVSKSS